ncbi:MAG: helix-turn-helix transcriptional regulator [Desulfovibrio sp.]|nr:helix-turn-helix transcriptional regulator [Desulfovibrio sp.]
MPILQPDCDAFYPDAVPRAVVAMGIDVVTKGVEKTVRPHRKAHLLLTMRGVVTLEADHGVWIVPPRCALWIPSGMPLTFRGAGALQIYGLFVEPDAAPTMPRECRTITVSPLLQELLLHAVQMPMLYEEEGPDGRIVQVLLDQLAAAPVARLNFPMPQNEKLRTIAISLLNHPADRATIAEWGRRIGMAERTLSRALHRDTGMSFGRWRQQLHILIALQRLAQGGSVQAVALDLGYESASAFITMFKKVMGKSPARYFMDKQADRPAP